MTPEITSGLALLRKPFPANQISKLPKPYKKDSPKGNCQECGGYHGLPAVHLDYVGHAALTDRLLDADPNWAWEPMALRDGLPAFDASGGLWIRLTVCGTTRIGYGHAADSSYKDIGAREKEVIGDALRNAAMRFGAALDLWHKGDLHVEDEPETKPLSSKSIAKADFDQQEPEEQTFLVQLASDVKDGFEVSETVGLDIYIKNTATMDAGEKNALWSCFNSKERALITKLGKERREQELTTQA